MHESQWDICGYIGALDKADRHKGSEVMEVPVHKHKDCVLTCNRRRRGRTKEVTYKVSTAWRAHFDGGSKK